MRISLRFAAQVVGIPRHGRRLRAISFYDRAEFRVPELRSGRFPVSVVDAGRRRQLHWHEGSHWGSLERECGSIDELAELNDFFARYLPVATTRTLSMPGDLRHVEEDHRPEIISRIEGWLARNALVYEGDLFLRCAEPAWRLRVSSREDGPELRACPARWGVRDDHPPAYPHLFRIDDRDRLEQSILDLEEDGYDITPINDAVLWGVPDYEVAIPESIELDGERESAIGLLREAIREFERRRFPDGSEAAEALSTLKRDMGQAPETDIVERSLTLTRHFSRALPRELNLALELARSRLDRRDISLETGYGPGSFLSS